MGKLYFETALLPEGWADRVLVEVADDGTIRSVAADADCPPEADRGAIGLPGLPNLHSHAFQRGMAGLAEVGSAGGDSFWTWRQVMYRFLDRLLPDDVEAIAAQLQVEMLEAGFTSVAEFHYLHHAPDGSWYADPAEMAGRIASAARETGIGLTLLPVLYAQGGFGSRPVEAQQRRFAATIDSFDRLIEGARAHARTLPHAVVGIAPHSLRAVTPESLTTIVAAHPSGPIHIHVAEQQKEVADCLAWSGRRPVEWLLAHQPVDRRWCLIHATHMTSAETAALAGSGAVAGLCPQTEANLGDGIFEAPAYLAAGGSFGIGTDSHIRVDAAEELRTLEYGQRLRDRARNVLGASERSTGRQLYSGALSGGATALGRRCGAIADGYLADFVGLDPAHPLLAARRGDRALDSWLFAGDHTCVRDVWVAGRRMVAEGRHRLRERTAGAFAAAMRRVLA
jgi:formiminoglutamate deiminase